VITFSQLGQLGRLGNQLFQFAAVRAVSLEKKYELKIPNFEGIVWHNQRCLLDNFNIECDFLTLDDYYKITNRYIETNHSMFYKDVFSVPDNTDLYGFFQNYQYFSKYEKEIRSDFELSESLKEHAEKYINNIRDKDEEIVSLHFRRGDNIDGTSSEYGDYYGKEDKLSKDSIFGLVFF